MRQYICFASRVFIFTNAINYFFNIFSIFAEYASLKPKKREGGGDMDSAVFLSDQSRTNAGNNREVAVGVTEDEDNLNVYNEQN